MIKIAEKFFKDQKVKIDSLDAFFKSDLSALLEMIYKTKTTFDKKKGLIKVVYLEGQYWLHEHVYYDHGGENFIGYINLEGLDIDPEIANTADGLYLSTKGYCLKSVPLEYQSLVMGSFSKINYRETPLEQGSLEPFATFKFNSSIWKEKVPEIKTSFEGLTYWGLKNLLDKYIEFSGVLSSLDAFDLNLLEWRKGRSMAAHNGVDYRSFINMITYNTEFCDQSREIMVGEYDWYDEVIKSARFDDWEPLMDIKKDKREITRFTVATSKALIINVFNPKWYHQVGEMKGSGKLYVCTANKSFHSIVNKISFKW